MKTLLTLIFCLFLGAMTQSCTKDEVLQPENEKPVYEAPKVVDQDTTVHTGFDDF